MPLALEQSREQHLYASLPVAGGVKAKCDWRAAHRWALRAQGAHLPDSDGSDCAEYALGMGPAILGPAATVVSEAVERAIEVEFTGRGVRCLRGYWLTDLYG